MNEQQFTNRASLFQISSFAGNNAATSALSLIFTGFFLAYGTNVYSFSPFVIGSILMGTRILDAITDPLIGVWVDRTNTKFGRFRPWIIGGSILMNASFILLFWGKDWGSNTLNLLWIIGTYIMWVIGYTFQTTITKAGQNVLTDHPKERTLYSAITQTYGMFVLLLIYTIMVPFLDQFGGFSSALAWRNLALVMVAVQVLFTVLSVAGLWYKDQPEIYLKNNRSHPTVRDYINMFKNNRALSMLIIAASTNKTANTMVNGLVVFFYVYVAQDVTNQAKVTPWMGVAMAISIVLTTLLTNRIGRKKAFLQTSKLAFLFGPIALLMIAFAPIPTPYWILVLVFALFAFVTAATELNIIPMIGDTADYEYTLSEQFVPGMIGSAFSLIDKFISSFAGLFNGMILALLGYVSFTETPPNSTLFWGILITITFVPTIAHLASIIAISFYPIQDAITDN
jgi:Na+/melibiose symporter-like transporter